MPVQAEAKPKLKKTQYATRALAVLKQNGYRLTEPRKQVIEILASALKPLAAYDIKALLDKTSAQTKSTSTADVTSVYRILECLEKNHLLHKSFQNGRVFRCELENAHGCESHDHHHDEVAETCHHFMQCQGCGAVQEIQCSGLDDLGHELLTGYGFHVSSHLLQINGLCSSCQP